MTNATRPRRNWEHIELAILREFYPNSLTDDIAAALGRPAYAVYNKAIKMGLRKSAEYLDGPSAGRFVDGERGAAMRFKGGHIPWNKGAKGVSGHHPNTVRAHFKKGRHAKDSHNYVPIGSLKITKDGYVERKISDDPSVVPARRWVAVHRLVWEAANGPVPRGHVVAFLPGRRTTDVEKITLDALELVSRAELARRNHPRSKSPELGRLVQLKGAITRQVNRIAREAKEKQS